MIKYIFEQNFILNLLFLLASELMAIQLNFIVQSIDNLH